MDKEKFVETLKAMREGYNVRGINLSFRGHDDLAKGMYMSCAIITEIINMVEDEEFFSRAYAEYCLKN